MYANKNTRSQSDGFACTYFFLVVRSHELNLLSVCVYAAAKWSCFIYLILIFIVCFMIAVRKFRSEKNYWHFIVASSLADIQKREHNTNTEIKFDFIYGQQMCGN